MNTPSSESEPGALTPAPPAPASHPPAAPAPPPSQPAAADGSADEKPSAIPDSLFDRMRADPAHAAEMLALAAVERFGPEAQQWVASQRAAYPGIPDEHLAGLTRNRFIQVSKYSGAVAGVAGVVGAVVDFGVLAWNQARMVLHLAAIYGEDPQHRDRAAELLMLQNVHKVLGTAQAALDVVARQAPASSLLKRDGGSLGKLALALAKMAGMRYAKRAVMKIVPFAAVPLGALANASSTRQLADRTIAFYAQRRQHGPQALPPGQ
jgi:hypothetical protein